MIYMKKVLLIALLLYGGHIAAQVQTDSVKVYYRVEEAQLDPSFHGNGHRMVAAYHDKSYAVFHKISDIVLDLCKQRFSVLTYKIAGIMHIIALIVKESFGTWC